MDRETAKVVKNFANSIKKKFKPEKIILFGSRARGDYHRMSDFDFIIVSEKFEGVPFFLRPSLFYDYWNEEADIEIICYTPEEFLRKVKEFGIARKALQEGVEVL